MLTIAGIDFPKRTRPYLLGIVNLTTDSFFEGSRHPLPEDALLSARTLADEGADILDLGGESTRPGAPPVSAEQELNRLLPALALIKQHLTLPLSIDTSKAAVAEACLREGGHLINDVSALTGDPRMIDILRAAQAPVILMHMQGTPRTMQQAPTYNNVVTDVADYLLERAAFAEKNGLAPENIILDPGIGFGKTPAHNLALLRHFSPAIAGRFPVLIGHSRKSFIGTLLTLPSPDDRLYGSLGAGLAAAANGAAFLRVHDIKATREALALFHAVQEAPR